MTREQHCEECIRKLGRPWDNVHAWLDAKAGYYFPSASHRQIRHHTEGVEEIRKMWGNEAAKAAELHIISDEGYIPTPESIRLAYGPLPSSEEIARERRTLGLKRKQREKIT